MKEIHLVDPSSLVIEALHKKIINSYITIPNFLSIHHKKGQEIIVGHPNQNCLFIAGMGGKEIQEILNQLEGQLGERDRVIISPHRKVLELREYLHSSSWKLVHEDVVTENEQFYPFLVLERNKRLEDISLYGIRMWHSETGRKYREHQLKYFSQHHDSASKSYTEYLLRLF